MERDKKPEKKEEAAGWHFSPDNGEHQAPKEGQATPQAAQPKDRRTVEWSASEFVAHDKSFGWYAILGVAAVVIATALYLLYKDVFTVVMVLLMAAILGVAGGRKPKIVEYRLDGTGLSGDGKFYPYSAYKSFAMPESVPFASIVLVPLKRFGWPVSIYLAPDSQDAALGLLSDHLPMERGKLDGLDRLMRWLKF